MDAPDADIADSIFGDKADFVPPATPEGQRPALLEGLWQGARLGLLWVSYIAGPIVVVALILGDSLTAFGLGAGRGFGVHLSVVYASGIFVVAEIFGMIVGGAIGLILNLPPRAFPSIHALRRIFDGERPIHFLPRRWRRKSSSTPRRQLWPWLVGVPTFVVWGAALCVGVYVGGVVDRRLADASAAADRDDPYWRLDDLMEHREPVPDDENSAIVVGEALALVPATWPSPEQPPGTPRLPDNEAQKASQQLGKLTDNIRLDELDADTLRDELDAYEVSVLTARTVADYRRGRHELLIGPKIIDTMLPETQAARTAARLLALDAAIQAHDGAMDGALDSCRAILSVARSVGDEPFAISQLVREACGQVAVASTQRVLGQGEPSAAALARLQALVLDELAQPLFLIAAKGERASLVEIIRRIGSGELPISSLGNEKKPAPLDSPESVAPWMVLSFDNQRAVALEWMNQMVSIARRPAHERPPLIEAWSASLYRLKESPFSNYTSLMPVTIMPALGQAHWAAARYESKLGAMAILLAAERHRLKTGDWPTSIASIDPAFLPSAPLDPFSGAPFHMERRDGQFLVYSVGPDLIDAHGEWEKTRWLNGGPDDQAAVAWDVALRRQPPKP